MKQMLIFLKTYQRLLVAGFSLLIAFFGFMRAFIQKPSKKNVAKINHVKDSGVHPESWTVGCERI